MTLIAILSALTSIHCVPMASGLGSLVIFKHRGGEIRGTSADLNQITPHLVNRAGVTVKTWNGGETRGVLNGITERGIYVTPDTFLAHSVEIERVKEILFA